MMIKTILSWVTAALATTERRQSHEIDPDEELTAAEKAELLAALNPECRIYFRDEAGGMMDTAIVDSEGDASEPALNTRGTDDGI